MSRKRLDRTPLLPYHVTARANNREAFPSTLQSVWSVFASEAWCVSALYEAEFQALVLMPNHIHAIITAPKYDLGKVMNCFMSSATRILNTKTGRSGHIFGGPYHWSLISGTRYFGHALKYIYRNPVKAGLCRNVEDWPYSTLAGLIGNSHLPIPIHFTRPGMELGLPLEERGSLLEWLNRPFPGETESVIQAGLRKKCFETGVKRSTRRKMQALEELI